MTWQQFIARTGVAVIEIHLRGSGSTIDTIHIYIGMTNGCFRLVDGSVWTIRERIDCMIIVAIISTNSRYIILILNWMILFCCCCCSWDKPERCMFETGLVCVSSSLSLSVCVLPETFKNHCEFWHMQRPPNHDHHCSADAFCSCVRRRTILRTFANAFEAFREILDNIYVLYIPHECSIDNSMRAFGRTLHTHMCALCTKNVHTSNLARMENA